MDLINIRNKLSITDVWSRWRGSTSKLKILKNHILGQDLLFVATPVVNNFERARINSNSLDL